MLEPILADDRNRAARIATWSIIVVNAGLLLYSLPDYRVSIDSGYHISLAEWYAHHGQAWWDHINYGPAGRPNLQGPCLHVAIAILGRLLGGRPDDFILANAMLGVAQWLAAILTVLYFARRLSGDIAALFGVALLGGSLYASGSFYVGIPSGWLFISVPWAIYFFLEDRLIVTTLIVSAACYTHLGGYLTAPVGVAVAAALERHWRALAKVGIATAILTAPYTIHFLENLAWYRGRHGFEAVRLDPLIDLLALAGAVLYFRHPLRHRFLLAWALAPIAWFFQDYTRFILQSTLAGSVLGGLFIADMTRRLSSRRARIAFAAALVALATFLPLGLPNLGGELSWDAGLHFPRLLDWDEARGIADVIAKNQLNNRLISVYETSFGPAIAVFTPITLEKGHWDEVQPPHDPADDMPVESKVYVVPLAPGDKVLAAMQEMGLVRVYGGTSDTAVITLERRGDPKVVEPLVSRVLEESAQWLGAHAVNNDMPPLAGLVNLMTPAGLAAHRRTLTEQRFRAGRMEVACLIEAYALEPENPERAKTLRDAARRFAGVAVFLSDGDAVGWVDAAQHQHFRADMTAFAAALRAGGSDPLASPEVRKAAERLFNNYFSSPA
jgi:hypothetical protein